MYSQPSQSLKHWNPFSGIHSRVSVVARRSWRQIYKHICSEKLIQANLLRKHGERTTPKFGQILSNLYLNKKNVKSLTVYVLYYYYIIRYFRGYSGIIDAGVVIFFSDFKTTKKYLSLNKI